MLPPAEGEDDGAGTKPQNKVEKVTAAGRDMADGVYDLRPYRAGDSLKQIHWKLTARVGELTVREPLGATYCATRPGQSCRGSRCAAAGAALRSDCRKTAAHHDPPQDRRPGHGTGVY